MAFFEFQVAGEEYGIEALNEAQALEKLSKTIGIQAAKEMLPSAIDFGAAPQPIENVFGDITSEAMSQPWEATKAYAQRAISPDRSVLGRVKDVGMAGLAGLGTGYAGLAGAAAELIAGDKTQERKLARDLMMMGEVAIPELTGVTSNVARLGRQVGAGKLPISREFGEMTPRMETARAAEKMGVLPSASMQGQLGTMLEGGLEALPISSGTIQKGTERVVNEMQNAVADIAKKAGVATTREASGEALQLGAQKFVTDFSRKSEALYNRVDRYIRPDDLIVAPNTTEALREILQFASDNPKIANRLGLGKYQDLLSDLGAGGIDTAVPYQLIKDLRSTFGEAIGNMSGPLADMSQAKIKRLYGTLSKDMEQAAISSGDKAYKAWKQANDYYRAGSTRIDDTLSKITNAETGQAAYKRIENMLLEGNVKQSTKQIMQIKKSLPKDDFNSFKATLINNLGRAKAAGQSAEGDVFSPSVFITNYNKMEPSSRRIVFGNLDAELNEFAKIAETARDAATGLNRSRTGTAVSTSAGVALVATGQWKAAVAAAALNYASAAAMTSKPFLKALNEAAKTDMGALQRLAQGTDLISADAKTILRTLSAQQANQQ